MGRSRSFDETLVVTNAARAFLATGYEATSLDKLVETTGLHRGSLYGAFGSKRGLFIAAMRLAESGGLTADEQTDLLLVALLELAATDRTVQHLAKGQVQQLPSPAALLLGARLLERAGVEVLTNT
jgi:TetR/AcrR family transcriptional repressor of nem operon